MSRDSTVSPETDNDEWRVARFALRVAGAMLCVASIARAQVAPDLHYRTIRTAHVQVVFPDGLENVARRAAGSAERAWAGLARELHEPRGPVTIVVADNYDTSNGYATPFPTNRIVIYARPSVDANTLKFIDDWVDLVVTHELVHIFHLDRTRGPWRIAQAIFGRNPSIFPNTYSPSWLSEGLAVYYESKLTGAGRDNGTDFDAIARAHALAGSFPKSNALSTSSPIYPLGNVAYAFGSPLVEQVARAGKAGAVGDFVETSARLIPFMLNTNARRTFGVTFDSMYRRWSDSVRRSANALASATPAPRALVDGGWFAIRPRWLGDTTVTWTAFDPRSLPSLRAVSASGGPVRTLAVRNTIDATALVDGGWRVFAQQDYTDAYSQRTDLYLEHDGRTWRLTNGGRFTQPDARLATAPGAAAPAVEATIATGVTGAPAIEIVATQLGPGTARLVRLSLAPDGSLALRPLTQFSAADLYNEPRWSRAGDRIAVTHWMRGGESEVAVLSADGRHLSSLGRARAVTASPSWGAGDSTLFFTNDRTGRSALYRANVATGALTLIADSPTALYEADVSPDGRRVATLQLRGAGLDLTVVDALAAGTPATPSVLPPSAWTDVATTDAPVQPYSAWSSLLPKYWTPQLSEGFNGAWRVGGYSNGYDLVSRHAWQLLATQDLDRNEPEYDLAYNFYGLGQPVLGTGVSQMWDHPGVPDTSGKRALPVARRRRFVDGTLSVSRQRVNSSFVVALGGSYEWRDFRTLAEVPIGNFPQSVRQSLASSFTYPSFTLGAAFSNARQPALALGPENGFVVSASVRQRWRSDNPDGTRATGVTGSVTGYRGFDFGGVAHHLLAVRVVGARQDITSATEYDVGGNSGTLVQVIPGITFGDGRRTFFVRGFDPGTLTGNNAVGMNAEYRFPFTNIARGLGALPVYFQRVTGVLFADAGTAWCSSASNTSPICGSVTARTWLSSVGGEVHLDATPQYDATYRVRFGVAVPVSSASLAPMRATTYLTLGLPF